MSLRSVRTVAGRAFALLVAGLVLVVLALTVVIPRLGGAQTYTILTGSMRPGMPPGTVVVVKSRPVDKIKVGDVITYQLRSGEAVVVTHRVVSTAVALNGTKSFTTQGDANNAADRLTVRPEQIRGVRWYAVPYLGLPSLWIGADIRQIVVSGAVAVLLGYALVAFAGAVRDKRREQKNPGRTVPADERELEEVQV